MYPQLFSLAARAQPLLSAIQRRAGGLAGSVNFRNQQISPPGFEPPGGPPSKGMAPTSSMYEPGTAPPMYGPNDEPMNDTALERAKMRSPTRVSDYIKQGFSALGENPIVEGNAPSMMDNAPWPAGPMNAPTGSMPVADAPMPRSRPPQAAFDPSSIQGFNPNIGNMADPQMSADVLGAGMQARSVPNGDGGMMNDFYLGGPASTGPDLVKRFMAYMGSKTPGAA